MTNIFSNLQNCPICLINIKPIERYPNYVCENCSKKACDKNGRKVVFGNTSFSGCIEGVYTESEEVYNEQICYIDGIECYADEARFGGIVIEKKED